MSIIDKLGNNFSKLPQLITQYEDDLSDFAEKLSISGKTLEQALKEQATWAAYYGERAAELGIIIKYIDMQTKRIRGSLFVKYTENYSRQLGERVVDKYIDREDDFVDMHVLSLEVQELAEKYKSVLDAFNRRGFALRDITAAKINDIHKDSL
jgi:hypothetical protein